ncbi:hypothetical protein TNCV_3292841 [Trichonephila clavipes]|nr:hypothetical protein TNCV_3292841 [Trichonephila clavipes]
MILQKRIVLPKNKAKGKRECLSTKKRHQISPFAASVRVTNSVSIVDKLIHFCLKVLQEIGVSYTNKMYPPIETRSSLLAA